MWWNRDLIHEDRVASADIEACRRDSVAGIARAGLDLIEPWQRQFGLPFGEGNLHRLDDAAHVLSASGSLGAAFPAEPFWPPHCEPSSQPLAAFSPGWPPTPGRPPRPGNPPPPPGTAGNVQMPVAVQQSAEVRCGDRDRASAATFSARTAVAALSTIGSIAAMTGLRQAIASKNKIDTTSVCAHRATAAVAAILSRISWRSRETLDIDLRHSLDCQSIDRNIRRVRRRSGRRGAIGSTIATSTAGSVAIAARIGARIVAEARQRLSLRQGPRRPDRIIIIGDSGPGAASQTLDDNRQLPD